MASPHGLVTRWPGFPSAAVAQHQFSFYPARFPRGPSRRPAQQQPCPRCSPLPYVCHRQPGPMCQWCLLPPRTYPHWTLPPIPTPRHPRVCDRHASFAVIAKAPLPHKYQALYPSVSIPSLRAAATSMNRYATMKPSTAMLAVHSTASRVTSVRSQTAKTALVSSPPFLSLSLGALVL